MRISILIIMFIFCFVFALPGDALAGTQVTVYIAGGFVIGGVSVFFYIFLGSERDSSKNEKNPEAEDNSCSVFRTFNHEVISFTPLERRPRPRPIANCNRSSFLTGFTQEDINQAGMVKLIEW